MAERRKKFDDESGLDMLLIRDRLNLGRYRKAAERNPEKRRVLIDLALEKIREAERNDYVLIGFRRRRVIL